MHSNKLIALFTIVLVSVCESAIVDTLEKCSKSDENCIKKTFHDFLLKIAATGIPEYDIMPLDPITVKNKLVSVLGLMDIYYAEATAVGAKECMIDNIKIYMDKEVVECDINCPAITFTGKYKMNSGPLVKNLLGNEVQGEGNSLVSLENIKINLSYAFKLEKHDDGKLYFKQRREDTKYAFDVLGNIKFEADNIKLGDQDVTPMVVNFINQNSKSFFSSFGKYYADIVFDVLFTVLDKFFGNVPATSILDI